MEVQYKINGIDFDDYFVRKSLFSESGLWTWGTNNFGQLGNNSRISKSSPIQTIAGGNNWKQVSCNGGQFNVHTAAIKTDGTLWLWGSNWYGELGDNTIISKSSPVQTVAGGTDWKQVSCGGVHTAAIKTDGTLWMWGDNYYGELGDNTSGSANMKSSPIQTIAGGTNWKQVSCGYDFTAAIKTDGTLWLWGSNGSGQLGDNTRTRNSSPIQTIAGGTNWKQVSCGYDFTSAIKTDGTLWLWGYNGSGQLGDDTTVNKSSPVQTIAGGNNWKQVSCAYSHTAAIKTDGTLWTWGDNFDGNLGDNTTVNKLSPVQTISGGTNWKQVSCGLAHNIALKIDGTVWSWGYNGGGELGDNSRISKSSPIQTIAGGNNWKYVASGYESSFGIKIIY